MKEQATLKILQAIQNDLAKITISEKGNDLSYLIIPNFSQGKSLQIYGFFMSNWDLFCAKNQLFMISVYLGNDELDSSILDKNTRKLINAKCEAQYQKDLQSQKDFQSKLIESIAND